MGDDQFEGLGQQGFPGLHAVPGRCAGRMGQGNDIQLKAGAGDGEGAADDGVEFLGGQELFDGEFANREDELRLEDFYFAIEPGGAILNFIRRGHAVAAGGFFAWETAAHRGHVNRGTKRGLVHSGGFIEPAKQSFPGCPGEGTAEHGLLVPGRLANEDYFADDRATADDGFVHLIAQAAGLEAVNVLREQAGGGVGFH